MQLGIDKKRYKEYWEEVEGAEARAATDVIKLIDIATQQMGEAALAGKDTAEGDHDRIQGLITAIIFRLNQVDPGIEVGHVITPLVKELMIRVFIFEKENTRLVGELRAKE